jgi:hypothetical protein
VRLSFRTTIIGCRSFFKPKTGDSEIASKENKKSIEADPNVTANLKQDNKSPSKIQDKKKRKIEKQEEPEELDLGLEEEEEQPKGKYLHTRMSIMYDSLHIISAKRARIIGELRLGSIICRNVTVGVIRPIQARHI